ncbi:MAG: hypothetical protein GPJ54_01885 [Candidatus Heimdallarchaeota archaeon]|nr:hypothetical protein [Candidatus Heimdallarchaeota archaeon]
MIGTYLRSNSLDPRSLIAGFLTVLLISGISFYAVPNVIDLDPNISTNWSFSSPTILTTAMENHLETLIYVEVLVGVITSTVQNEEISFSYQHRPIFDGNVYRLQIMRDLESVNMGEFINISNFDFQDTKWLIITDGTDDVERNSINSNTQFLSDLQSSLTDDLGTLQNYDNITSTFVEEIMNLELMNGEFYWEIHHLYSDSKYILIRGFGNTVIIQDMTASGFFKLENGFEILVETAKFSISTYRGIFSDVPFDHYKGAIDKLLQNFVSSGG